MTDFLLQRRPLRCHHVVVAADVVELPFSEAPYQKSRDTNPKFAVEGTEAGGRDDTIYNRIDGLLEITTTYGPQMFVTWLRIFSAR